MTTPLLRITNLEVVYGAVRAIRGISLEIEEGAIATVLGANGAGKSTILKAISGIVDPEKGEIRFGTEQIQGQQPDRIVRAGIAHVPEGREVFPLLSVQDNLGLGAYTRRDKRRIAEDLDQVYTYFPVLKKRRKQEAGELSGGQQQMLSIGRGLMARPRLLLLDEPSLGLSPLLTQEIFRIITRINSELGTTILLVEQNAQIALQTADHGYVLESGRIVREGACGELFQDEDIREFYLGQKEDVARGQRRWKKKKQWG